MRISLLTSLFVTGLVSACATVPMGGSGQASNGDAVFGELILGIEKNILSINTLDGLSCSGNYKRDTTTALRTIALSCVDGETGTAVMTVNAPTAQLGYQRATVNFKLSDGTSGELVFGVLS